MYVYPQNGTDMFLFSMTCRENVTSALIGYEARFIYG